LHQPVQLIVSIAHLLAGDPQSLQDLVTEGYLRDIPIDPMTGSNQTWKIIMEDATQSVNQTEPGIFDVLSGSDKMGLDGIPYSDPSW
jgi:general secretion pathway protein G